MRESYQSTLTNTKSLSQLKTFQINEKFELNRDDASYMLTFETDVPIDNILLQCDVPIDLLDSDKNTCVMSTSECDDTVTRCNHNSFNLNYLKAFFSRKKTSYS